MFSVTSALKACKKQYVARDLLNIVFGNSDNHGRNISFIKAEGNITFALIYDFTPIKADPEVISRLFRWERGCEQGGIVNFRKLAEELHELCSPAALLHFLSELADNMKNLP